MVRSACVAIVVLSLLESTANADAAKLEGVVNLNTASMDELRLLPGVGPARVRNILAYRHAHPFRTVDELARIQGIGRKTVRRLRLHLAVSGPSTAQRVLRPALPFVGPPPLAARHSRARFRSPSSLVSVAPGSSDIPTDRAREHAPTCADLRPLCRPRRRFLFRRGLLGFRVGKDDGHIDQVLGNEPGLQLIRA